MPHLPSEAWCGGSQTPDSAGSNPGPLSPVYPAGVHSHLRSPSPTPTFAQTLDTGTARVQGWDEAWNSAQTEQVSEALCSRESLPLRPVSHQGLGRFCEGSE